MKGIEIAKNFYKEFGKPMLKSEFADIYDKMAVGLVGSGSECLGFDDEISRDHDFEPGFCIFIPDEDVIDRKTAFQLERAYYKLPREYMRLKRSLVSPVGGSRNGVIRTSEFYTLKTGNPDGNLSVKEWLTIPEHYLCEAVNGEVFEDNYGEFTAIRNKLLNMPDDILLKKLAGAVLLMAQSGQYNYGRCIQHKETGSAQLAAIEFAQNAMKAVFLLNRKYMPFYKWSFRAMRELKILSELADTLEFIISSENDEDTARTKMLVIEDVSNMIINELKHQGITKAACKNLETHAYSINDMIEDAEIRNMNILAAV
ncbi:MAG: DUF4037 domain-containing protein [Clostridia bacterium]|nr:DUF4037 domain-containing protein [Clostridia bacterium]